MRTFVLLLALAAASGCNNPRNDPDRPADHAADAAAGPAPAATDAPAAATPSADAVGQPPADAAAPMPATDAAQGDPLALGLLTALNEHEIAAARQAQQKGVSGAVLEFANLMEKEHGANQAKTRTLGTPAEGGDVQAMKDKGKAELDALGAKSGDDYRKAYVAAMVKGHQDALEQIDNTLMPAATGEPVKAHLRETREHVAMHLDKARKLPQD